MDTKALKLKLNLWCGYELDSKEQAILTNITMMEFNKPVNERRKPFKLVEEARAVKYFSKKWKKEWKQE